VVIVPLKQWEALEDRLEDFEMSSFPSFRKKVAKARAEKKRYTSDEAKKMLGGVSISHNDFLFDGTINGAFAKFTK
jgi:F0F1-type ATP synthase delta subunit